MNEKGLHSRLIQDGSFCSEERSNVFGSFQRAAEIDCLTELSLIQHKPYLERPQPVSKIVLLRVYDIF